jgi:protease IV
MPQTGKSTHSRGNRMASGRTRSRRDWIIGLCIVGVFLVAIVWMASRVARNRSSETVRFSDGGGNVGVVELLGTIYDSERVVKQFETFGEQKSIKAIVFRIESPGGYVAPSQEIYEAARRVRDGGKPVVVSMGTVAASGGYYAACGADSIVANPGTTTGSIGVVAEFVNVEKLLEKIGVRFETLKSGRFKDTGSPTRDMTDADRAYLQSWIDDAYGQFVDVVAKERRLARPAVLRIADGRVFTGRQAKAIGLVDVLGDYRDAVRLAGRMGGIKGEPELVRWRSRRVTLFDLLFQQTEGVFRGAGGARLSYRMP